MSTLGRLWAGNLYGTNTGKLFAEIDSKDGALHAKIHVNDDRHGVTVHEGQGTFDGSNVLIECPAPSAPEGVAVGSITVRGALSPEGRIEGQWESSIGTAGTFVLFPHDRARKGPSEADQLLPEQIHTATRSLGAMRLYAADVEELIQFVEKDFRFGRAIVTYYLRGNEISKYARDFVGNWQGQDTLHYLKIFISEPEAYGINRTVTVELNAQGGNDIKVQGVQEAWVIGKAESLAAHLRSKQKWLATTFRRFGLNINGLLALGALVALPDLTIDRRVGFAAVIVAIIWFIGALHRRFIPNVAIYLSAKAPGFLERSWPQVLSWLIAASSAVFAAVVYGILKGEITLEELLSFFQVK